MRIIKSIWMERLEDIHRHWAKKTYSKLQRKLSNLVISLRNRSAEHENSRFSVTKGELEEKLYSVYGTPCPYCGTILKINKHNGVVCDHIVPLAYGGDSVLDNLQFICSKCNTRKDTLSHSDFSALLEWLNTQSDELRIHVLGKLSKKKF